MTAYRICFFGDSFVAGAGDDACQGWPGRLGAFTRATGADVTIYNCGVRGDTSEDIRRRWRREAAARLWPGAPLRLVFSFGANDCGIDEATDRLRVSPGRSVENARAILSEAQTLAPTLMIGVLDTTDDGTTAGLTRAYAALCAQIEIPFLDVTALSAPGTIWRREAAAGDGAHPNAGGYAAMAEAVAAWPEWTRLFA